MNSDALHSLMLRIANFNNRYTTAAFNHREAMQNLKESTDEMERLEKERLALINELHLVSGIAKESK